MVSSNYFVFWLRKLLSATKTTKNPKTSNKNQKNKKTTKDSEECLRQGLCLKAFTRKKRVSDEGGLDEEGRGLEP